MRTEDLYIQQYMCTVKIYSTVMYSQVQSYISKVIHVCIAICEEPGFVGKNVKCIVLYSLYHNVYSCIPGSKACGGQNVL